MLGSIF